MILRSDPAPPRLLISTCLHHTSSKPFLGTLCILGLTRPHSTVSVVASTVRSTIKILYSTATALYPQVPRWFRSIRPIVSPTGTIKTAPIQALRSHQEQQPYPFSADTRRLDSRLPFLWTTIAWEFGVLAHLPPKHCCSMRLRLPAVSTSDKYRGFPFFSFLLFSSRCCSACRPASRSLTLVCRYLCFDLYNL